MGTRRFGTWNGTRRAVVATVVAAVGLGGALVAGPAFAEAPAAAAAHAEPLVPGTPCSFSARSCVDLESQQAWLIENGNVVRGPVKIASGGNGQETPVGHSLRVYRKEQNHLSQESRLPNGDPAPMPWSVFFEDGGIAFHAGSPERSSAGCIHLEPADAEAWFQFLQIGDMVQVVKASEEMAARNPQPPPAPA
ncbi:L,D-transpeptidase [Pseudonocardia pini]|uniref:L,D-transpeptidase n=1 Tax=Pseudonocardia pini TaxID=2758030 RepID=UPI0015F09095|nr:L,D-transpeptidase [Pseudonocardia pini]